MLEFIRPDAARWAAFTATLDDFEPGWIPAAFLDPDRRPVVREDEADFRTWVGQLHDAEIAPSEEGWVTHSPRWIVEGDAIVGFVDVRHELNDNLRQRGGHIGYSVAKAHRNRGIATTALRFGLAMCAERGIDRALLTCDDDNVASINVIERCGGVRTDDGGGLRHYWVPTTPPKHN